MNEWEPDDELVKRCGHPNFISQIDTASVLRMAVRSGALLPRSQVEELVAALRGMRREHRYVEDCWYSCPKAIDGCCDDSQGDECNCGADEINDRIDRALASVSPQITEGTEGE